MTIWPQISVALWLLTSVSGSLMLAVRPTKGWIIIDAKRQRIGALMFAAAALTEAAMLWAGGFFERML